MHIRVIVLKVIDNVAQAKNGITKKKTQPSSFNFLDNYQYEKSYYFVEFFLRNSNKSSSLKGLEK